MPPYTVTLYSHGAPRPAAARPRVQARYDNATTHDENKRLWWGADYLSAKSANSFQVRRTLRMRSRYEVSNNPYLWGVANGNADDLVDAGPTLQVLTPDAAYNREVEAAFADWATEVGLAEKLRTCKLAKTVDGEGFLILKSVPDLEGPVKLFPVDVEADQVTTPAPKDLAELWVDGLTLHPVTGKPTAYHVLRHHPGDYYFPDLNPLAVEKVAARNVVHWFPKFRPGQVRGVPVFTPSLGLFTELRAFRAATLKAAEVAADFSAVLEQDASLGAPPDAGDDGDGEYEAFRRVPIDRGMFTMLPPGAKLGQLDAKHPATTYEMFQEKALAEALRPLAYPLNLALGTSQKFNFSSAKLDHINYRHGLTVERADCEAAVLRKVFREWYAEAVLAGVVRVWGKSVDAPPPHEWHWPGFETLDPEVDARADAARLAGGMLTWREFWAKRGYDYRDVFKQLRAEAKELAALGLEFGDVVKRTVTESVDDPDADPKPAAHPDPKPADKADPKPAEKPGGKPAVKKAATADVQNTALNGAQVASLVGVCDKLVTGAYTGDATKAIIRGAFPGFSDDLIDTIVKELEGHTPPPAADPAKEPANAA